MDFISSFCPCSFPVLLAAILLSVQCCTTVQLLAWFLLEMGLSDPAWKVCLCSFRATLLHSPPACPGQLRAGGSQRHGLCGNGDRGHRGCVSRASARDAGQRSWRCQAQQAGRVLGTWPGHSQSHRGSGGSWRAGSSGCSPCWGSPSPLAGALGRPQDSYQLGDLELCSSWVEKVKSCWEVLISTG